MYSSNAPFIAGARQGLAKLALRKTSCEGLQAEKQQKNILSKVLLSPTLQRRCARLYRKGLAKLALRKTYCVGRALRALERGSFRQNELAMLPLLKPFGTYVVPYYVRSLRSMTLRNPPLSSARRARPAYAGYSSSLECSQSSPLLRSSEYELCSYARGLADHSLICKSFNVSPNESQKIGFKRLNIINLLAKTNLNFSQDTQYKDGKSENDVRTSLQLSGSPHPHLKDEHSQDAHPPLQKERALRALDRGGYEPTLLRNHSREDELSEYSQQGERSERSREESNKSSKDASYFFRYSRINEYKKLGVELASPDKIRKWAERLLPTGRVVGLVVNANTLHHKTLKPLKGGLFCERIFGPTKDFRCACGKTITKRTRLQNTTYSAGLINVLTPTNKPIKRFFCKICEVEYTWALTRRYQLGFISLAFPVTHLWYTKGFSSPISLLLDIHKYDLDSIIYCSQTTSLEKSYEITEMGISLQASQVLSFVSKNNSLSFKSNTTLLQNVRTKNQALIQARLRKRKKAFDSFGRGVKKVPTLDSETVQNAQKSKGLDNTRKGTPEWVTKDICEFEKLEQTIKETQRRIQQTSIPTYINDVCYNERNRNLTEGESTSIGRAERVLCKSSCGGLAQQDSLGPCEARCSASPPCGGAYALRKSVGPCGGPPKGGPSLVLQSLIVPLIVTYSTQFFAPFVFWLVSFDTLPKTIQQTNTNLVSMTLLKDIFTKTLTFLHTGRGPSDKLGACRSVLAAQGLAEQELLRTPYGGPLRSKSTAVIDSDYTGYENGAPHELKTIEGITKTLAQLKNVFTESIDTLEDLPDIIERQYHKALLDIRTKIQTLPVQTFCQINEYFYKQSYTISILQTKEFLKNFKLSAIQSISSKNAKVSYFLKQLKELFVPPQNGIASLRKGELCEHSIYEREEEDGRGATHLPYGVRRAPLFAIRKNGMEELSEQPPGPEGSGAFPQAVENNRYEVQLKQLALRFFLYKLKKHQAVKVSVNTLLNDSDLLQSKNASFLLKHSKSPNKPSLTFYYNLYGIADDHLWDAINDWNLVKSYITLYPDVMDQIIPAYGHRIPSSSMTNFSKNQLFPGRKLNEAKTRNDAPALSTREWSEGKQSLRFAEDLQSTRSASPKDSASERGEGDETISFVQEYKKLPKKYLHTYFQTPHLKDEHSQHAHPLSSARRARPAQKQKVIASLSSSRSLLREREYELRSYEKREKAFDIYQKSALNHQALPIKSTGAGILNIFLNSITLVELQAMDRHFTFLLKESRKTILTYKTKIIPSVSRYSIQPLGEVENARRIRGRTTTPTSRTDRYAGIDKFMEKHHDLLRRAKVVRKFALTSVVPKAMILKVLPVLPPELRPIMKMADQIATSDLNRLYQRVLYRNERLTKIVLQLSESVSFGRTSGSFDLSNNVSTMNDVSSRSSSSNEDIKRTDFRKKQLTESETRALPTNEFFETPLFGYEKHYAQRLLQEAVDNLIDNGRAGANTEKDAKGRALKSLSEVLKGKQGRFRQYLLGKRVDYSGRSVIVVGPKLQIHECGLPREMAVELYLPFIIQYLIQMKYTKTVVGAKTLITREKQLINSILDNVVRGHPIILNRAPTLHRLGFQAFQPILVEGRAILLHPMACTAFNADFDGDQMAVHIPITIEARSEAWRLMLARNNLLSPATGEPIILPSQDMVLGCYYLTTTRKMKYEQLITSNQYFSDVETALYFYYLGKLHLHTPIWVKTRKTVVTDSTKKPLEIRISVYGTIQEIYLNTEFYYDTQGKLVHQYIRTTPGRILFNLIIKNSSASAS